MDTVSHIVLGAAIGETIFGKKIGRKAMLYGALAGNIPDIDVFGLFFLSDSKQLLFHRGITHSLFFVVLVSLLLGFFFKKWHKNNWKQWTGLFFIAMLSHLILDSLTCYGMGLFEPFSHYRISFNTIFVVDPFYTLPLLVCMILSFRSKNYSIQRKKWSIIGLSISTFYLAFTILNHEYVYQVMKKSLEEQKLISDDFTITPTPLNTFLWMAYSHDKKGAWIGYYSIFDENKEIDFHRQERNDSLLIPFEKEELVKNLKQLSKGNYFISKEASVVYFNDIRFGQVSGWDITKDEPYAFKFNLNKSADNKRALNRIKFKESKYEWFSSLVNRIKGK